LGQDAGIPPVLEVRAGETGNWLHVLHRLKSGRDIFLICNQNQDGRARDFTLRANAGGTPECWDAMRNEVTALPFTRNGTQVEFSLTLEPSESVLLVFRNEDRKLPERLAAGARPVREPILVVRDTSIVDPVPRLPGSKEKQRLADCSWVWFEAGADRSAPPGARYFRSSFVLPSDRKMTAARFALAADNEALLLINGREAGQSSEWSRSSDMDIAALLKPGRNQLAICAKNGTHEPNPAGLIGRYEIVFESGAPLSGRIDETWRASDKEQAGWEQGTFDDRAWPQAKVVAAYGNGPWGRVDTRQGVTLGYAVADIFHGKCTIPSDLDLEKARIYLVLDEVAPEAAANITVNGTFAGGFIGAPLRIDVTARLRPGANTFTITPFAPKSAKLLVY
jgi:hypothetical protein